MKANITQDDQNVALSVSWRYEPVASKSTNKTVTKTTCIVSRQDAESGKWVQFAESSVTQNVNDPFNREVARKRSLAKTLGKLFPKWTTIDTAARVADNQVAHANRTSVWEAYHNRGNNIPGNRQNINLGQIPTE